MRAKLCSLALLVLLTTTGCGGSSAKGPKLISFADRQRSRIEPAVSGGTYGSIVDKLQALPEEVFAGQDVAVSETILNEGLPGKGVRLIVSGTAVTDGLLGAPKEATVKGVFADKTHSDVEQAVDFQQQPGGAWIASLPDLQYGSQLDVNIITKAVKGGNGDLQLFVQPLDKFGESSVAISHNYKILDERDPNDIQVPTD